MSDLKHLTYEQLCKREEHYRQQLRILNGKVNNKKTQLEWVLRYKKDNKPKTIDFTKLPVDTLVSFNGSPMYLAPSVRRESVRLFYGGDSIMEAGGYIHVSCDEIKLVEGRKVVWEGGECPLPDGVEVRVKHRDGGDSMHNCSNLNWVWRVRDNDIIWYQITGRIV